jgi:hypothetical protein
VVNLSELALASVALGHSTSMLASAMALIFAAYLINER